MNNASLLYLYYLVLLLLIAIGIVVIIKVTNSRQYAFISEMSRVDWLPLSLLLPVQFADFTIWKSSADFASNCLQVILSSVQADVC